MKKILFLALLPVLISGCSSITNLTPSQYTRNASGVYSVEAAWNSRRQAIKPTSFQPVVKVGSETYPLHPVAKVHDRWEGVIPVPADQNQVRYQFKFDYKLNAFGAPKGESTLSPEYTLNIVDRK